MGKKAAPEPSNPKRKQKRKEMFTQLATHQEQIMQGQAIPRATNSRRVMIDESQQEVQLQVLEHQSQNMDALCQVVHKLLNKNKVSAKNAFEVPLINLQKLPDFRQEESEHSWKKFSSTLQNDYKIYGFRVDAIHSITYSILNNMARRQHDIDSLHKQPEENQSEQPVKIDQSSEAQYLQRKIQNLNFTQLELVTRMDPVLQRTKRQFDLLGQQSMMLDTLPIDQMLGLQLVRKSDGVPNYPPWGIYEGEWRVDEPMFSFIEIAEYRSKYRQSSEGVLTDELFDENMEDEGVWMLDEKQNQHYNSNRQMELGIMHNDSKRQIASQINFKYPFFRNQRDIADDADNWMGDMDRKILGLPAKKTSKPDYTIKNQNNQQNISELIDFNEVQLSRSDVFKPDPDKMEHREEIEDKFLLANRMPLPFDIKSNVTFLRQNLEQEIQMEDDHMAMREEVDVRRQNISIMEAKRKIKQQIHDRSTFRNIYESYDRKQEISPALCFLTILHVANEANLQLQSIDQTNFYVR